MMVGSSGTSKMGISYNYYSCNNARKKLCNKKAIRKEYIEDLVVEGCRKLLTDENIEIIAREVVNLFECEKDNSNLKRLQKLLKDNEKQKYNLLDSLKICEIDAVKKTIFEEIARMETDRVDIEKQIAIEEAGQISISVPEIKFFLTRLRKGDVNDIKYRKVLINVFVSAIYLYDDKLTCIFNVGDKSVNIDSNLLAEIEKDNEVLESSYMDNTAPPNTKITTHKLSSLIIFLKEIIGIK